MRSSRAFKPLSLPKPWVDSGAHSLEELNPPAAAPKELTHISGATKNVPGSQGHSLHPPPDCSALGMPRGTQAPALTDVSSHSSRGCRSERGALGASPSSPSCSWPYPLLCPGVPSPMLPLGTLAPSCKGSSPFYTDPQETEQCDPAHIKPRIHYQRNGSCPQQMQMPQSPTALPDTLTAPLVSAAW